MNISPEESIKNFKDKEHIPKKLVVEGYLSIWNCTTLTRLPSGLVVKGNLYLNNCTSLTHLPSGLVVEGTIYCDKALIDKIPYKELPLYLRFNLYALHNMNLIEERIKNGL